MPKRKPWTDDELRNIGRECLLQHLSEPERYPFMTLLKSYFELGRPMLSDAQAKKVAKWKPAMMKEIGWDGDLAPMMNARRCELKAMMKSVFSRGYQDDPESAKVLEINTKALNGQLDAMRKAIELEEKISELKSRSRDVIDVG